MFIQILQNTALLCFAAVGLHLVWRHGELARSLVGKLLIGLSFGFVAFLVTATPVVLPDGATIDARAGPVILAGIVGGPVAAIIAGLLGALARGYFGGYFVFSGVVSYAAYALAGSALSMRYFTNALGTRLGPLRIAAASALSIFAASLMYFLITPQSVAIDWITQDFPVIAVANTLSIIMTGYVVHFAIQFAERKAKLISALKTLELAKSAGGIGIWEIDPRTGVASWDDINQNLHGLTLKDGKGTFDDWAKTLHPEDQPRVQKEFEAAQSGTEPFNTTYRVIHPDGSIRHLKGNAIIQRDEAGTPIRVVGANVDLTSAEAKDRALLQSQRVAAQAQKLDAIGKLTGGVAHDFNNLLAVIQGNLELLLQDQHEHRFPESERADILTSAISATRRGGELTRNMLAFARMSRLEPKRIKVNDLVRETEAWLARAIPTSIEMETNLQHGLWQAELDPASLQSALVNTVVNARDAMPDGGKLTIETSNVRIDSDYIIDREEDVPPGRYVMLAVTDTGTGIPEDLLPTVFEPFVSSKDSSVGSGLGLSMVQGFVKQSRGFVRIYSEIDVGTSIKMFFPALDSPDQAEPVAQSAPPDSGQPEATGLARILIAEDQLEVLSMIVRTLTSAGYTVDAATNGQDAYDLFKANRSYDLLLTDVVMPGEMRGPDLARACRALEADLPVIFMSGYASEATVHGNGLRADDIRLMKPVPRVELLGSIERLLEKG
tara:strand:- start:2975 stop:5140 length:2166 start_codon:yes stop_codon:yes gene_type:complete